MFDKYLRAISDENERKEILRLLRFRIAAMAVAVAALIALVVESVVFDGIIEKAKRKASDTDGKEEGNVQNR